MATLTLRFTGGDATYEFVVDAYHYPLQINNAFIVLMQRHGVKSEQIEGRRNSFSSFQSAIWRER